jgi:hypothetical protein
VKSTPKQPAQINCRKLIVRFGGPANLYRRLIRRGFSLSYKSIEKWHQRGQIRAQWLAELVLMAQEDGYPIDLIDYIERSDEPAQNPADERPPTGADDNESEDDDGLI